jgi:hypothetical protein
LGKSGREVRCRLSRRLSKARCGRRGVCGNLSYSRYGFRREAETRASSHARLHARPQGAYARHCRRCRSGGRGCGRRRRREQRRQARQKRQEEKSLSVTCFWIYAQGTAEYRFETVKLLSRDVNNHIVAKFPPRIIIDC